MTVTATATMRHPIAKRLARFLGGNRIERVHQGAAIPAPPPLAYLVNFPRLTIVLSGGDRMRLGQEGQLVTHSLHAGHAVFIPANCWNEPLFASRVEVLTLLFGARQTGVSLARHQRGSPVPDEVLKGHFHRPTDGAASHMLWALDAAPSASNARTASQCLLVEALLHECAHLLENPVEAPGGKADRSFQQICLYLQENFHRPITRASVADHFGLSQNHVSRLFRTAGLTRFNDYIAWVRLDRAKYLLRHHDMPLQMVARRCGFNDFSYFCRVFKRRVRMTPTAYRSQG